jgi:uncharacterized protein (TIGR03437 family)
MMLIVRSLSCRIRIASLFAALVFTAFSAQVHAQTLEWARQFGSARVDEAFAVTAGPNSVYVGGETFGGFPEFVNAGNRDAFVAKFDTAGALQWTRQFGTDANDTVTGVAADASGVYVVGRTAATLPNQTSLGAVDAFVRKYDVNGNEVWTRQFGTDSLDEALGVAVDATGVYVVGKTSGALPGQTSAFLGQDDAFVRQYDANGAEVWTRQFGTSSVDRAHSVAVHASGVYVAGITGGPLVSPPAGTDGFVRKYDSNGTAAWTRQITSDSNQADMALAVAVDSSGVYVSGDTVGVFAGQAKTGGLYDAWAQKYSLDGAVQWTRQFGGTSDETSYGIAVASNWVYASVYSSSGTARLSRFDLNGNLQGSLEFPAQDRTFAYGVAVDGGAAYLAGDKNGSTLGQTPLGDLDALLVKVPHPPSLNYVSEAFTGQPGSAPSTWISLYGSGLSTSTRTWDGAINGNQLPTSLDGVSAQINNRAATIYFISPGQVNVIAPLDDITGPIQVTLTNPYGTSLAFQATEAAVLPAFYAPFGAAGNLYVTAVALDGTLVGKVGVDPRVTRAARPGEVIQFFATGFGRTEPSIPSDQLFMGAPMLVTAPRITIGGRDAALYSGNGNLVGPALFQLNLTIPDLQDGDHAIVADIGGVKSLATVILSVAR